MDIGKKIYFDNLVGNVILVIPEMRGELVAETTVEEDLQLYKTLNARVPETVGVLQLDYGQYARDFQECNGYTINPSTLNIEFSYPDPNVTEPQVPVYQIPLSAEVATLRANQNMIQSAIDDLILNGGAL